LRFREAVRRAKPPAPHGRAGLCARRDRREVIPKLQKIEAAQRAAKSGAAGDAPDIVKGAVAFASIFTAAREGKPFELSDADNATSEIISSIEQKGLGTWLDDVRRYHQGTFQHCLLVTGVAVGFALDIKFPPADVGLL